MPRETQTLISFTKLSRHLTVKTPGTRASAAQANGGWGWPWGAGAHPVVVGKPVNRPAVAGARVRIPHPGAGRGWDVGTTRRGQNLDWRPVLSRRAVGSFEQTVRPCRHEQPGQARRRRRRCPGLPLRRRHAGPPARWRLRVSHGHGMAGVRHYSGINPDPNSALSSPARSQRCPSAPASLILTVARGHPPKEPRS